MFGGIKRTLHTTNASLTMESAGLSKETSQVIAASFPDGAWKNLMKCTKGLNNECKNLCHSFYILHLFEKQQRARAENTGATGGIASATLDLIKDARERLAMAIGQQGVKGHRLLLDDVHRKVDSVFAL